MTLTRLLSPLTSLVIFILGHGMFNTLLTVRLSAEQVSVQAIGLVSAAYFGGLVLGAFINARLIIRVGHIRAYAAYASLLCFLFLMNMVGALVLLPALARGLLGDTHQGRG